MENKTNKSFFFKPTVDENGKVVKWDKREFGYTALVGLLRGYLVKWVVGDVMMLFGLVCLVGWLYKVIRGKKSQ